MRVVYVTERLPFGHGETFVIPEIEALLEAGHEVLIVPRLATDPVLHDRARAFLPRTRTLPGAGPVIAATAGALVRHPVRTLRAFWRLRRTRPRRRGISNAISTAHGIWLGRIARDWGADHIHAHWAHLTATTAMAASESTGIPWSFTAHRFDIILNNLLEEKLRSARFGRFIARELMELGRTLVAPAAFERATLIHMGVRMPPASGRATPRDVPVVLCAASLIARKGHAVLFQAASRLAQGGAAFELWLAGDGPLREALVGQVADAGLAGRVSFLGTVGHDELLGFYEAGRVDCLVLPSIDADGRYGEGISVSAIEAMSYGVPVVSSHTGGMPELLRDGAGLLVPPGDAGALAAALARVLGSAELRAELSRAGRRRIEAEFDVAEIADQLVGQFRGDPVEGDHVTDTRGPRQSPTPAPRTRLPGAEAPTRVPAAREADAR